MLFFLYVLNVKINNKYEVENTLMQRANKIDKRIEVES